MNWLPFRAEAGVGVIAGWMIFVVALSVYASCSWLRSAELDAPGGFAVKVSGEPTPEASAKAAKCGIVFITDDGGSAAVTNYFNPLPKRDVDAGQPDHD